MEKLDSSRKIKILQGWIIFSLILICTSFLPHWQGTSVIFWFNSSLYFLLFILSFFIFLKDTYTKTIFLNLAFAFFLYSLVIIQIFIGNNYLIGNDRLGYFFIVYKKIVLSFITNYSLFYITIRYTMKNKKESIVFVITFALSLLLTFFLFQIFILKPGYILSAYPFSFQLLLNRSIISMCATVLTMFVYFLLLYKYDRPNGEYVSLIMVSFVLFSMSAIVNEIFALKQWPTSSVSQYIAMLHLLLVIIVLVRKIKYTYSTFGEFYESVIFTNRKLSGLKIIRRGQNSLKFFRLLNNHIIEKKNYYTIILLITSFIILLIKIPMYLRINIFVILLSIIVVFIFFSSLLQRRVKNGNYISRSK